MDKRKETKILHQLISTIGELNASFERKDISRVVIEGLCKIFSLDSSFFYSLNESRELLTIEAQKPEGVEEKTVLIGHGPLGWVAKTGELLVVTDKISSNKYSHFISVPVKGKKGILGVIGGRRTGNRDFDDEEKEYLSFFSSQVGSVMENYIYYHRLRRSKEFRDIILYNIPSGILVLNPQWKIKTYNKSATLIFNGDKNLKNLEIFKVLRDEVFLGAIKRAFEKGLPVNNIEVEYRERFLNINVIPLTNEENEKFDLLLVVDDITEIKKAYEDKERASRLSYLGQFVAGVAHELRNPLTGINITLDMVKEDINLSDRNRKLIDNVLKEISLLEDMLTSLLEISKPMDMKIKKICLGELIKGFLESQQKVAEKRGVRINFSSESNKIFIMGDEKKLRQALINLFNNSIESMPSGGDFTIRLNRRGNFACIEIQDTGTGISKNNIEKIFDPFFTTKQTGTGLGLYITKSIISHHKGKIRAESDGRSWTRFIIEIPLTGNTK
ncbi:MAG: ATP-binding protein [Proteobacteria bacterium]|nr:ATP-binding protein [Pseudomonadota bacterium]